MRSRATRSAWICLPSIVLVLCGRAAAQSADEATPKKSGEIAARVLGSDGKPRPDAEVRLLAFNSDWRTLEPVEGATRNDTDGFVRFAGLDVNAYLLVARADGNLLAIKDVTLGEVPAAEQVDLVLSETVTSVLHVRDPSGQPVAGAWVYSVEYAGPRDKSYLVGYSFEHAGFKRTVSNAQGELELPPLPPGGYAEVKVLHADYAPAEIKDVAIAAGGGAEIVLEPGVKVTFRTSPTPGARRVPRLMLDLRREGDSPSTLIGYHPEFDAQGIAQFTIAQGEYYWLRLQHPELVVTPIYSEQSERNYQIAEGSDWFAFELKPKVTLHGRIVDASTGEPINAGDVEGEIHSAGADGPLADFAGQWTHIGWGTSDADGCFAMTLAAGPARLTPSVDGYTFPDEHVEIDVAADGSTVVPDVLVTPMPKVRGTVTTSDGQPVAKAVVRFGGWLMATVEPVLTDDEGRFELAPRWFPIDPTTKKPSVVQVLVAFHPYEPLAGRVDVRLDDATSAGSVAMRLVPQAYDRLLKDLTPELSSWERGEVNEDLRRRAATSLVGKPAPELDGMTWLNTEKSSMCLADFRGKYVLLDFWTTWCGPCHADFPTVKLVDQLYRDKGLVVVGVHDNSMPLDAIRADAAKEGLTFAIVADHPDGRLLRSYDVSSWPSYVLIGPDGTVVRDFKLPGPTLRTRKLEIIRELVMGEQPAPR